MDLEITDRVAVVTGGSRGLGFAAAESLVREGAKVAIGARSAESLDVAVTALRKVKRGATVLGLPLDVTDASSLTAFSERVRDKLGAPTILVANNGGPPSGSFEEIDPSQYAKAFEATTGFVVRLVHEFLPAMRMAKWGRIVAIASVSARQPIDGLVLSNTGRAALLGFAKSVANSVGKDGVTMNVVLPGFTRTERLAELAEAAAAKVNRSKEEILDGYAQQSPLRRIGEPREIGDVIAFLASERASFVTGAAIAVDGGFVRGIA